MCPSAFAVVSSIESTVDLLRVCHLYYNRSRAFIIFYEADGLVGVIYSPSLLLISFNYFVKNTPINIYSYIYIYIYLNLSLEFWYIIIYLNNKIYNFILKHIHNKYLLIITILSKFILYIYIYIYAHDV